MRIIEGTTEFQVQEETAISIGKFDGLHQGHQLLVERIVKKKQEGLKALIFTFDFGDRPVLLLPEERREMLRKWGVDYLLECPFVESISHMEAEEFVRKILVERLHVRYLAVGTDFRFGCQRRGDYRLLQRLSAECGYEVEVVEKACWQGEEISSSRIRRELELGDMDAPALRAEMARNLSVMRASVKKGLEEAPRSVSGLSGGDAQKLVSMLKQTGGVQQAAQAAAQGDASQLMGMMNQLMSTKEGAALVERLRRQAEESGLS